MAEEDKFAAFKAFANTTDQPWDMMIALANEKLPELPKQDLSGKVIVITGANVGIGFETAKAVAAMNPKKVILACRNLEKGKAAMETIQKETGCKGVEVWHLDLASFESVQTFAKKFNESGLPLDILVSNAGLGFQPEDKVYKSENGLEMTIQVNHIANVLLVLLLTPSLKKASAPRVNVVSSDLHYYNTNIDVNDTTPVTNALENVAFGIKQYGASKLMNILFVTEYVKRCPYNIWMCSSHPGFTDTQLGTKNENGDIAFAPIEVMFPTPKRTVFEGAKTIIHASISPEIMKEPKGVFVYNMRVVKASAKSQNRTLALNTWNDTMNILKKFVEHDRIEEWAWKQ